MSNSINIEEAKKDLEHKKRLLEKIQENLRDRELLAANHGGELNATLIVRNELKELRKQENACKEQIVQLETMIGGTESTTDDENVPPHIDSMLHLWVLLAENYGLETSVTLSVRGNLISGQLVSYKRYIESQIEQLKQHMKIPGPEEDSMILRTGILDGLQGLADSLPTVQDRQNNKDYKQEFFTAHLRNARIWHPGQQIDSEQEGFAWRVQLESVDGFQLGMPFEA